MSALSFFLQWGWAARRDSRPLTESEARARHEAGEQYYVRVPRAEGYCIIHVLNHAAVVIFLDAHNRYIGEYQFDKEPDGRVFLQHTTVWSFETPEQERGSYFHSRTLKDGTAMCTEALAGSATQEEFDTVLSPEELRVHWDWFPAFGHYDHLCIFDRSDVGAAPESIQSVIKN